MGVQKGYIDTIKNLLVNDRYDIGQEIGMSTVDEFDEWYKIALGKFGKEGTAIATLKEITGIQNLLAEFVDPTFASIVETGSLSIIGEKYKRMKVEPANEFTDGEQAKPITRKIVIPFSNQQAVANFEYNVWFKDPIGEIGMIPKESADAFKEFHARQVLSALLVRPDFDQSASRGCLFRDTHTFATENQVTPFPVGDTKFDNTESHYLFRTDYDLDLFDELKDKIESKGYGRSGISYLATKQFWRKVKNLNDWTVDVQTMFQMTDSFFSERGGDSYIEVSNNVFPEDYVLAFDHSVRGVYRKEAEDVRSRGVRIQTSSFDMACIEKQIKYFLEETGIAIQERGFAAVMYIKADATDYVNPTRGKFVQTLQAQTDGSIAKM